MIHCEVMSRSTQDTLVAVIVVTGTNSFVEVLFTLTMTVDVESTGKVLVISQRPTKKKLLARCGHH